MNIELPRNIQIRRLPEGWGLYRWEKPDGNIFFKAWVLKQVSTDVSNLVSWIEFYENQ